MTKEEKEVVDLMIKWKDEVKELVTNYGLAINKLHELEKRPIYKTASFWISIVKYAIIIILLFLILLKGGTLEIPGLVTFSGPPYKLSQSPNNSLVTPTIP